MKLLFFILAHDCPDNVIDLARTLVDAGSDAHAMIHFDANAREEDYQRLVAATSMSDRITLAKNRASCRWGGYGLVQAVLNMIEEVSELDISPDYAILLSGACLPCRPIAALERFLDENRGHEFIETADERWMVAGLRHERYSLFHVFDMIRQPRLEKASVALQRRLRIRRRFPRGLKPRFGSQWWALTWSTCRALSTIAQQNPATMRFFRTVFIPDEIAIQSIVYSLCPAERIAGHNLVHWQFTDQGKPVVYFDDHVDYVPRIQAFFFRKAAPGASKLRRFCHEIAARNDDGQTPDLRAPSTDYEIKVRAQTSFPVPGQIFYRDQHTDMEASVLRRVEEPYVLLYAPEATGRALLHRLRGGAFEPLGALFAPGEVDFGDGRENYLGLKRGEHAIRDVHQALYLARVRRRATGVPVLLVTPGEEPALLGSMLQDHRCLVVACLPQARSIDEAIGRSLVAGEVPVYSGVPEGAVEQVVLQMRAEKLPDPARWLFKIANDQDSGNDRVLAVPMGADEKARHRVFSRGLMGSAFKDQDWFEALGRIIAADWPSTAASVAETAPPNLRAL
ncbi:MAG: beta-1,6-N-acetylglucosaminyltransferase [Pseudomonadota bacterium]